MGKVPKRAIIDKKKRKYLFGFEKKTNFAPDMTSHASR